MKEIKYSPDIQHSTTYTCPICDSIHNTFERAVECRKAHLDLTNFKPTHFDDWTNQYDAPRELFFKVGNKTYKYNLNSVTKNESEEE